jgi:hypothetical protein
MKKSAFIAVAVSFLLLGFLGGSLFQIPIAGQSKYTGGQLRIEVVGKDGKTTTLDFNKVWPAGLSVRGTNMTRGDKGGRGNVDIAAGGLTLSPARGEGPARDYLFEDIYRIDVTAMCDSTSGTPSVGGTWTSNAGGYIDKLEISPAGSGYAVRMSGDGGRQWSTMVNVKFDAASGSLEFTRPLKTKGFPDQIFRGRVSGDRIDGTFGWAPDMRSPAGWTCTRAK